MTDIDNMPRAFLKNMVGMVVASMMAMLGIVVDGIVISRFLGTQRMAAYGLVTPITNLIMVFSGILSSGSQVVCGKYLGAGDKKGARLAFSECMVVTVLLSVLLMGMLFIFRDGFCRMLGAVGKSAGLLPLASDYLLGMLFSIPAVLLLFEFNGLMRLDNDPNRIIVAVAAMTILDIAGDLLNALVIHGDMLGMGLSTSISYTVALGMMLLHFRKKDIVFHLSLKDFRFRELKSVFWIGSSSAVGAAAAMLRNRVLNGIMLGTVYAVTATAALSVLNTIMNITSCTMVGLGMTCSMFAGIVSGKEDRAMARELVEITVKMALVTGAVLFLVFFPFARVITGVFAGADSREMAELACRGLRFYCLGLLLYGVNTAFINYTQGMRKIVLSNVFCILENFVFIVLPALALAGILDSDAVWISYCITEVVTFASVLAYVTWKNGRFSLNAEDYIFMDQKDGQEA